MADLTPSISSEAIDKTWTEKTPGVQQHEIITADDDDLQTFGSLLPQLTLEEKSALLSGADFVTTNGVERLNIPSLKTVDAVNGVKGSNHFNGTKTACFPSTNGLGATWNAAIMKEMGAAIAKQAKLKSAQAILGPALNIHRDPRGGRNFECFSEDPVLAGQLAAGLVEGIQSEGVAAIPKHFVANDSEYKRRLYNVAASMNSRTIREIYMATFQQMLLKTRSWGLMTAYNKLDGVYCAESPAISEIIRKEWSFDGMVMSDWFGTKSGPAAINAGLDMEMPGPSVFRGAKLVQDVKEGRVAEVVVDERVANVLRFLDRTRSSHSKEPEKSIVDEATNTTALNVAAEGIVLLQNRNNTLPLDLTKSMKVAVVGANPPVGGGGSASVPPQYEQNIYECIKCAHEEPDLVKRANGVKTHEAIPIMPIELTTSKSGKPGFDIAYFNNDSTEAVLEEHQPMSHVVMIGRIKPGLVDDAFHFTVSTTLTAPSTGIHNLAAHCTGNFKLYVDEKEVVDAKMRNITVEDFLFVPTRLERKCLIPMTAGEKYNIKLVAQPHVADKSMGEPSAHSAKLCFLEGFSNSTAIADSISVTARSDVSIIFAGRNQEHESEGFDMESIKLPQNQIDMIRYVAAASPKTVLVLSCGNPIDVSDFVDEVDAIVLMHFGGQEGCQAVTDIITGKTCPSGRLAVTWPKRLEDTPSYGNFPAKLTETGWEIRYEEGLGLGYRNAWKSAKPQWEFGHGLSYTTFEYDDLKVSRADGDVTVSMKVKNTGAVTGSEVVQVYVEDVEASVWRPKKELKGFAKESIPAGETRDVTVTIPERHAFSFWDETALKWKAEKGEFRFHVAGQQRSIVLDDDYHWSGL